MREEIMCDEDLVEDVVAYRLKSGELSRRHFGALSLGVGLVSLLPPVAGAADADLAESEVDIKTPDGTADAYLVHPARGAHPGVLMWPDIFGLRPAFRQMGRRLAGSGYSVLVVNPFYRSQRAPTAPEHADFEDPATRAALTALREVLIPERVLVDARAFVAWLDGQPSVDRQRRMAAMGYCMSGPFTMRAAAELPDRIGAGASFHGGGLVTDKPDSPHLLVPKIKAQYYFGIAANDDAREPEAKVKLREAFSNAGLVAKIEVYSAQHGWCVPDMPVRDGVPIYNKPEA